MKQLPPLPQPFINLDNTPGARLAWGAQMQQYALDAIAADRALNGITGGAQPAVPAPPECKTHEERTAYAFGWWKAMEWSRTHPAAHKQQKETK